MSKFGFERKASLRQVRRQTAWFQRGMANGADLTNAGCHSAAIRGERMAALQAARMFAFANKLRFTRGILAMTTFTFHGRLAVFTDPSAMPVVIESSRCGRLYHRATSRRRQRPGTDATANDQQTKRQHPAVQQRGPPRPTQHDHHEPH